MKHNCKNKKAECSFVVYGFGNKGEISMSALEKCTKASNA